MSFVAGVMMVQAWAISVSTGGIAAGHPAEPTLNKVEAAIIRQTNATRAKYGRPPLVVDQNLLKSARRHARWMTYHRTMRHTSPPVAENVAMGQRSTSQVMQVWMNSSGHRANILNRNYGRIGVAAYRSPDGKTFWCQQFLR